MDPIQRLFLRRESEAFMNIDGGVSSLITSEFSQDDQSIQSSVDARIPVQRKIGYPPTTEAKFVVKTD